MSEEYKTSFNKQGYIIRKSKFTEKQLKKIKDDLNVTPAYCPDYQQRPESFKLYKENVNKLYVPRFYGFKELGNPDDNKIKNGKKIKVKFEKKLRPVQEEIISKYEECRKEKGGGIISAGCGVGKTVMGIYLISKIGLKTLVLVHKEFLLTQWKERIKEFLPEAKIGEIQGKKCDVVDKDIVIGMIQTVSGKQKYPDYVFRDFGFMIADECHHLGAKCFSRALRRSTIKYTLGLSATPKRKDGLSKVFKWYLGDICYKSSKPKQSDVITYVYKYFNDDPEYNKVVLNMRKKVNNPVMINNLCSYEKRNKFIFGLVKPLIDEGRTLLILTERITQVNWFIDNIEKEKIASVGRYVGGMKQNILDESLKCKIIVGTYNMIEEGFDCKALDTLIMATPKIDIEQTVGRILRKSPEERIIAPLVIDIWDLFGNFKNKGFTRLKFYKNHKYKVKTFCVDDNKDKPIITEINNSNNNDDNSDKKPKKKIDEILIDNLKNTFEFSD